MINEQTASWFQLNNPVIPYEQMTIETDTRRVKYGDGESAYNDIEYSGFVWRNNHLEIEGDDCCCFQFDYGSFTDPNNNTPIDAGTFISPAINFWLDLCYF